MGFLAVGHHFSAQASLLHFQHMVEIQIQAVDILEKVEFQGGGPLNKAPAGVQA
jgi:hypothetical protein